MAEQNASPQANGTESTNSIELTRGSKGFYQWVIKVRFPIGTAADQTLADIKAIDQQLRTDYPTAGE